MLPYQASQNSFFIDVEQVGTANAARLPPYTLHIPMCSASHVPLHVTGSSQQQSTAASRGWPFAPCHAAAAAAAAAAALGHHHHHHHSTHPLTLQPCCTAAAPHFLAPSHFYHAATAALPPPPAYHQLHHQHAATTTQTLYPPRHDIHPHAIYHRQQQPSQQPSHIVSQPSHRQNVASTAAGFTTGLPPQTLVPALPSALQQLQEELSVADRRRHQHATPYVGVSTSSSSSNLTPHQTAAATHHLTFTAAPAGPHAVVIPDHHVVHPVVNPSIPEFTTRGSVQRYRRSSTTRQRWRTIPPPPYPGILLHFPSAVSRQHYAPHRLHLHQLLTDDTADLDSYEALLNLAERLGDAKPRGLTRPDIDRLPCYRFNAELRRTAPLDGCESLSGSVSFQTSCVVCLGDFESRQLLRALPCKHEFHARCVDKWLKVNRTCPICRADTLDALKAGESAA